MRPLSYEAMFSGSTVSTVAIIVWDDWIMFLVVQLVCNISIYWLVFLEVQFGGIPLQYTVYCVGILYFLCVQVS